MLRSPKRLIKKPRKRGDCEGLCPSRSLFKQSLNNYSGYPTFLACDYLLGYVLLLDLTAPATGLVATSFDEFLEALHIALHPPSNEA